ncbi:MAG: hypothetical protein Q4G36_10685 [Paracoccus sp. (in: a-proteobacteria)]|nr:hypothetical protein [Paracoccus sp. (in: a-proteobacteria)]
MSHHTQRLSLIAGALALPLLAAPAQALLVDNVPDETIAACQADPGLQGCATVLTGIYVCENAPDMQGCAAFAQRLDAIGTPDNPAEAVAAAEGNPALEEVVVNARGEGALVDDLDAGEFTPEELAGQEPEDMAPRVDEAAPAQPATAQPATAPAPAQAAPSQPATDGAAQPATAQPAPAQPATNAPAQPATETPAQPATETPAQPATEPTREAPADAGEATTQQAPGLADEPQQTVTEQPPEGGATAPGQPVTPRPAQ